MDSIKFLNTNIDREKIVKLGDTQKPSSVVSLWERLKILFGLSNEEKVLTLINTIYFDQNASVSEKNSAFFKLKKIAGAEYKNNLDYVLNNDKISYIIRFKESRFISVNDINPFFETIKNELSIDLSCFPSNSDIKAFINNYSKLSAIENDENDKNYEEKITAFRAILTEWLDNKKFNCQYDPFEISDFDKIKSFKDKRKYIEDHTNSYTSYISPDKLIDEIYQSMEDDSYEKLRLQAERDIPRWGLKYNNTEILNISSLDEKLKELNEQDIIIIFELLNQGLFPLIKNSFAKQDAITSKYSFFTGRTTINIDENKGSYFININNKKEVAESDVNNLNVISNNILTNFDHDSMNLYIKYFLDNNISIDDLPNKLAQYQHYVDKRDFDSIGDKFNYEQKRFLLLEENINVKFEFNPHSLKKLTIVPEESKIEYRLFNS
ncbi:TPA: hypothetical protein SMN35_003995 [Proteus mirabilis]